MLVSEISRPGTRVGEGYTLKQVIGCYKLGAAPRAIMLQQARGSKILGPI
jgi:hypothetical protein